jgi:hypothetical protein
LLAFLHCLLYCGESVNIRGSIIARPASSATMCGIVAKDHLQPCAERQLLHDLAKAPAGDFGEPVTIARQPTGAV